MRWKMEVTASGFISAGLFTWAIATLGVPVLAVSIVGIGASFIADEFVKRRKKDLLGH